MGVGPLRSARSTAASEPQRASLPSPSTVTDSLRRQLGKRSSVVPGTLTCSSWPVTSSSCTPTSQQGVRASKA
jgi:hypothetical protein